MLDGTYFNGWCVIIAHTRTHVVDWDRLARRAHRLPAQIRRDTTSPTTEHAQIEMNRS
jgi:hypothetical protein